MLIAFIIGTLYKSSLKASLISPKYELPFKDIEEFNSFSKESGVLLFVSQGSFIHQVIKVIYVYVKQI